MALQSSGQIKLSEIATEFGGSAPHSMSEYYAGGTNVSSGTGSIPSSGEIQLAADFYGTSAEVVLANSNVTSGFRHIKSGTNFDGYSKSESDDETFTTPFGSIADSSISGTSTIINSVVCRQGVGGYFQISFSAAFTGWTSVVFNGSTTITRASMTADNGNKRFFKNGGFADPTSIKIIQ